MMRKLWVILALLVFLPLYSQATQTTLKVAVDATMDSNPANETGEDWRLTDFENWSKQHSMNSELYHFQGPWVTLKDYTAGEFVNYNSNIYVCVTNHTSGTFATDLAAVRWKFWGSDIYAPVAVATVRTTAGGGSTSAPPTEAAVGDALAGKQVSDTDLTAIAALTCTENQIIKRNSSGTWVCGADNEGAGGGISHATSDGNYYASRNGSWASLTGLYLAAGGTAANSSQLEGHAASYFQTALTNPVVQANLGTGMYTFLGTPSGANLAATLTSALPASKGGTGITSLSANVVSYLGAADYSAMRTLLGLVIGTNVQAYDADLTTWAGVTPGTGVGTFLATPSTTNFFSMLTGEGAFAATLLGYADAASAFAGIKQAATESATGVIERATTAEVVTGSATDLAVTPAGVTARMAAPGEIGGTTPNVVNATAVNMTKVSGTPGRVRMYDGNSTDVEYSGRQGPANVATGASYLGQDANAGPTAPAIQVWGASTSGDGSTSTPYIHPVPFVNFDQLFTISGSDLLLKSGTSLPGTCSVGALFLDTDADTNGQLYSCVAINTWKDVDDDGGAGGLASTDIDTSAKIRTIVTDESGTGALLFAGGDVGAATATTASAQDNDTSVATTAFVNTEIAADAVLKATVKSLDFDWKSPVDADDRMIRLPTAVTVTGLYCIASGSTPSIAVALNECDNAGANCAASGATVTADGGVDSDTTITDGAYDAADYLQITVGAPTGTVGYLTCSVTYTN